MMNREGQPTNEELLTPKKHQWQQQVRHGFKLIVTIQRRNLTEAEILKFQKQVEDLTAKQFQGGTAEYKIE